MPSPPRVEFPGAVYHVTSRGNARQPIYRDRFDRELFLETAAAVIVRYRWHCHAYCLMTNHYHLLLETPQPNLSLGLQRLNAVYAQAFNRRHDRVGHLFEGRYKAIVVEREPHLLELVRYVVLNPVRARACRSPGEWLWSSYAATAGLAATPEFLAVDWILAQFAADRDGAQARYRAFVAEAPDTRPWRDLRCRVFLGSSEFARAHTAPRAPARRVPAYGRRSSSAACGSLNGGIT